MTTRDLDCIEVVELVTDYLEGALDPETSAAVEHHLSICSGCLEYVRQLRSTSAMLGELDGDQLSEPVRTALVDAFRAWSGQPPSA